ncbi:unnamed protein product [Didymodactylos carnosus]|uniref:Vps16 C-terminal domain-containing protein n=1 Tax=Didymodactylos carnosus TaxID=1234261 RepID=A0A8S2JWM1_9BILA|nr:unnamed protein product [Didymodactylos carnosus]CAF3828879.1 unnamed protein product [Didymodactylos carnosus]
MYQNGINQKTLVLIKHAARAVRTQPLMSPGILPVQSTPSSSPVTIPYNSNKVLEKQWQPTAEDYPNNQVQDGSTLFDYQMKAKCVQLMESKNVMLLNDVKDYDAKESLLRQAVALNTPSVTIPVIMFLENTLSRPLFYELINQHPSAINSYINMCKLRLEKEYYVAMLKQFGKREDVAMLRIRQTSQANDMQTKVTLLTEAMNELHSNVWWHTQVSDYMRLLQKQQLLHSLSHGRSQVENRSLLHTYKVVYNSEFRKPDKHEFKELETNFKMSPELSLYGKLSVIIENGISNNYQEFITTASQPTGILRQKHIISPHILADMVYNASRDSGESMEQASDRAKKFLTMIADPEKRVFYAEKFGNYEVAIDTIVNHLKDRTELENLRRRMPKDHAAINKATMLLDSTKWKN